MGCCHGCTGGILGWVWGESVSRVQCGYSTNLFKETIPLWDCSGVVAGIVSQLVVSGQIIGVGVGLMATFSPSSVYSWQAGLLKIDVPPAIVKLFKVVSLATLLSSVS